jgi:uncharacterized protein (DUF849 family)
MTKRLALLAALAAALASAPARGEVSVTPEQLDRCLKSVNLIGASLKHVEATGSDGKPVLQFLVRSSGSDYDVTCDATTGMVRDVSAHIRQGSDAN